MSKGDLFYSLHRQTTHCPCAIVDRILSIDLLFFIEEIQLNIIVAIINCSQIYKWWWTLMDYQGSQPPTYSNIEN